MIEVSGAADAPLLQISRTVTITTDAWKGVSSAGVTWSYDAEASAVSDDTPTLAQPTIPVYAARGFIPYSIEVGQDYPGFADEMSALLSQGFVNLLAKGTMTGSGHPVRPAFSPPWRMPPTTRLTSP
jgi:HK97 family phage major capsid protein